MALWQQILWYALWLGCVFTLAEILRVRQCDEEIVRKVIHIGVGNIIWLAWLWQVPQILAVGFSALFSLLALLSYRIKFLPSLNGAGRQSFGAFFYAVSFAILMAVFWRDPHRVFAVIGILVMTWGDALAALVGKRWGSHSYEWVGVRKSWEGSLTMWGISSFVVGGILIGVFGFSWTSLGLGAGIGAVVALVEVFSWQGVDNITLPAMSAGLSFAAWWFLWQ